MKVAELENAPEWLKNAKVENEDVEIVNDEVVWNRGDFINGDFYGKFMDGNFLGGNFNGVFMGGKFYGKNFLGDFIGSNFSCGCFYGDSYRGSRVISSGYMTSSKRKSHSVFWIITDEEQHIWSGGFYGTLDELRKNTDTEWYKNACNAIGLMIKE